MLLEPGELLPPPPTGPLPESRFTQALRFISDENNDYIHPLKVFTPFYDEAPLGGPVVIFSSTEPALYNSQFVNRALDRLSKEEPFKDGGMMRSSVMNSERYKKFKEWGIFNLDYVGKSAETIGKMRFSDSLWCRTKQMKVFCTPIVEDPNLRVLKLDRGMDSDNTEEIYEHKTWISLYVLPNDSIALLIAETVQLCNDISRRSLYYTGQIREYDTLIRNIIPEALIKQMSQGDFKMPSPEEYLRNIGYKESLKRC